jgi:hypothetical protein
MNYDELMEKVTARINDSLKPFISDDFVDIHKTRKEIMFTVAKILTEYFEPTVALDINVNYNPKTESVNVSIRGYLPDKIKATVVLNREDS